MNDQDEIKEPAPKAHLPKEHEHRCMLCGSFYYTGIREGYWGYCSGCQEILDQAKEEI
jgi:hypothetical protein